MPTTGNYSPNAQRVAKPLIVTQGGAYYLRITSGGASAYAGTGDVIATRICTIANSGAAQTGNLVIYDAVNPNSPSASEIIWTEPAANLTSSFFRNLNIPLNNNLVVNLTAALSANSELEITFT